MNNQSIKTKVATIVFLCAVLIANISFGVAKRISHQETRPQIHAGGEASNEMYLAKNSCGAIQI